MTERWRPTLLQLVAFGTWEPNITQPQEREVLVELRTLLYSKELKSLKGFKEIADDHGLALIEDERNPDQASNLDSYRLVKKVTDDGMDINPSEVYEKLDEYTIAIITFEKKS
jgi:hypothetical protein